MGGREGMAGVEEFGFNLKVDLMEHRWVQCQRGTPCLVI